MLNNARAILGCNYITFHQIVEGDNDVARIIVTCCWYLWHRVSSGPWWGLLSPHLKGLLHMLIQGAALEQEDREGQGWKSCTCFHWLSSFLPSLVMVWRTQQAAWGLPNWAGLSYYKPVFLQHLLCVVASGMVEGRLRKVTLSTTTPKTMSALSGSKLQTVLNRMLLALLTICHLSRKPSKDVYPWGGKIDSTSHIFWDICCFHRVGFWWF